MKTIQLSSVRIDGDTQPRAEIDAATVERYAETLMGGENLPPVVVFDDGASVWLADGFHRFHAARKIGALTIEADVRVGTLEEAQVYSLSANARHGLPMNQADRRRAVERLLKLRPDWPDSQVATHVGVSRWTAKRIRESMCADAHTEPRQVTRADGKAYTVKPREAAAPAPAPAPRQLPTSGDNSPREDAPDERERDDVMVELAEEVQRLSDRLAVEAMDATEEEKTLAADTIAELRTQVASLEVQLRAVQGVRDQLMQENAELKRQCLSQQRRLKKLEGSK